MVMSYDAGTHFLESLYLAKGYKYVCRESVFKIFSFMYSHRTHNIQKNGQPHGVIM